MALVAAGIGAAGVIGGSAISASATSDAASSQAQSAANSLAVQQQEFNQGQANEAPWLSVGHGALDQLASLYGIAPAATTAGGTGVSTSAASSPSYEGYSEGGLSSTQAAGILFSRPDVQQGYDALAPNVKASFGNSAANYAGYWYNRYGQTQGYNLPATTPAASTASAATSTNAQGGASTVNPDATFYQSPDYNFALDQGIKGVDAGAAATGMLDSGATQKAEIAYAGNLASGQYDDYVSKLQNLSGLGQAAASGTAAQGQAYANAVTGVNTTAGNAAATAANASGVTNSNALTQLAGQGASYVNSLNNQSSSYNADGSYSGGVLDGYTPVPIINS